jgi:hypothetical protein
VKIIFLKEPNTRFDIIGKIEGVEFLDSPTLLADMIVLLTDEDHLVKRTLDEYIPVVEVTNNRANYFDEMMDLNKPIIVVAPYYKTLSFRHIAKIEKKVGYNRYKLSEKRAITLTNMIKEHMNGLNTPDTAFEIEANPLSRILPKVLTN